MLHNTGQFGNDVPINMNGQTNLTSINDRLNIDNNINNMNKIVHEGPQSSTSFNIPEYGEYGLNMNANLGHFQYHPLGYQPTTQNSMNTVWQNNMLPVNLNNHNDQNMLNYQYAKESLTQYKDLSMNKQLISPQVQTKAYHKQIERDMATTHDYNIQPNYKYADYNLNTKCTKAENDLRRSEQINLLDKGKTVTPNPLYIEQNIDLSNKTEKISNNFARPYRESDSNIDKEENVNIDFCIKSQEVDETVVSTYQEETNNLSAVKTVDPLSEGYLNLSKSQESTMLQFKNTDLGIKLFKDQDSRRRSLENTVKMIENILSHSSNTRKSDHHKSNLQNKKNKKTKEIPIQNPNDSDSMLSSCPSEDILLEYSNSDLSQDSTGTNKIKENQNKSNSNKKQIDGNKSLKEDCEDIKPALIDNNDNDVNIDNTVVVKIEVVPCNVDTEHLNPFHLDPFGVKNEDVSFDKIIDSENSVNVAKEVIKNDPSDNSAYYECPHCYLYFNHPKRFLIHTKWHSFGLTNDKRIELQKEKEMKRHMKREAKVAERLKLNEVTDVNSPGRKFSCKDCDKIFITKASLKNHRQRFHATRTRDCKICGKTVPNWTALRMHLTTHTSEAGFQCSDCPKRFKHSHSLAKHRDTHLEKTHACAQCPKKFGSAALLNVHMKTHERLLRGATFRCTYCGKGFFEAYSLQVHERTHRNERPFLCEICNTSFGTNSSLKRHLKVSHSTSKPYECSTCHRSFISEAIRDRHTLRNHGDPDNFKFTCKQCPCKYLNMKDLRKHIYKAHPKGRRKKKDSDSE